MNAITFPKYLDFPEYAAEAAKMKKLKNTLADLISKKADMSRVNQEHEAAIRLRGENLDNLIESGDFESVDTGARFSPDDFAQINSKANMVEQAIQKHQVTMDKLKNLIHPEQLKDVKKKYKALVKKIADNYAESAKLHEEEKQIIDQLEAEDIRFWGVIPRVHTANIGYFSNEFAWIHFFLREAEQQGYLKAKDYF